MKISEDFRRTPARLWETDPAAWRLVIDAYVNGPFYMARAGVRHMLGAGWGRAGFSPYGPSKAARVTRLAPG